MKKITIAIAILVMGAVTGCSQSDKTETVSVQTQQQDSSAQRINFQPGAVSANVIGTLKDFDGELSYVIEVNAGQTMSIEQVNAAEHRITLGITDPSGEDVTDMDLGCNGSKTITPTVAGDYNIQVRECMKADPWNGEFTLVVTVK